MSKVTGIKSVDFKITAYGYGVVNWNGPTTLTGDDGTTVDNHSLPKLRGYSNLTGRIKETGYKYKKEASDIDFSKTPLYISQNCIRHHLFRDQAYDLHYAKDKNLIDVLASITGLIRGYVVPSSQCKRTSPLLITDFIDQLGNGNFEQMGRSGSKEKGKDDKGKDVASNSFYSKTTFGDTEYVAYGSISIEQLEFISLDKKFDRASMIIKEGEGEKIAETVQEFIQQLDASRQPKAVFHPNYVRKGTIFEEGEVGILLDNTAIDILVNETLNLLRELSIKQAKGYMYVESVEVDYNDSNKMMRIKRSPEQANLEPQMDYAVYFEAQ
ncbi:type I-Fv CRISPR-associated protein Cas7fv [Acinetobacter tibetensis]|uniref:Type I-Fv CRISPR-associated protein Cas7fv n=1 Tax=Acinetobacter tibetensis TaxID=2943497 RepID=A0AAE9LPE6_9GAMM|nr:type I-Fv CRISPR-associated protein Cas7fv [Acinetobacter tibetensis]USE82209.1 type I-Fv CRISPR-associated protein Cas7fv [Acinetobacter tibetensis]